MEIKNLKANTGNVDIVGEIVQVDQPRTFEKFGKSGKVCNAKLKDSTGIVVLTLWNDDIDKVKVGDKVHIQNGWCSEFKGEKQVSTGKFGKIEVLESGKGGNEVFTNDSGMLQQEKGLSEETDEEEEPDVEDLEE